MSGQRNAPSAGPGPVRLMVAGMAAAILIGACPTDLRAERLAIQPYDVTDGLVGDYVQCIEEDSRGELWIGTNSGLSRFDGRSFTGYTTDDGLPDPSVLSVVEDGRGVIWAGTAAGLASLDPSSPGSGPLFEAASCAGRPVDGAVFQMALDRDGIAWVAAGDRLVRAGVDDSSCLVLDAAAVGARERMGDLLIEGVAHGSDGELWLGTSHGLARRLADDRFVWYPLWEADRADHAPMVILDQGGRVWTATAQGVLVCVPEPAASATGFTLGAEARELTPETLPRSPGECAKSMTGSWVLDVDVGRDGTVWVATVAGLLRVRKTDVRVLNESAGLVDHRVTAVHEDRSGSIWIGSQSRGLMRLDPDGFVSYDREDGIGAEPVTSVVTGVQGAIVAVGSPPGAALFGFADRRAVKVRPALPSTVSRLGWGWNQVTFMDSLGFWWVPTEEGLYRFPPVERLEDLESSRPDRVYRADVMGSDEVFRVWEDAAGDVWLGLLGPPGVPWTVRWERRRDRFVTISGTEGFPNDIASAFANGRAGSVFIGLFHGGVVRFKDGVARSLGEGSPPGFVNDLLLDHTGRLWVASHGGLGRCDEPDSQSPRWRIYGSRDGIGGEMITALAEDRTGRVYAGSYNGIWRIEPDTGRVVHLDTSSGLVNNHVLSAMTDADGTIWFATAGGVSMLHPHDDRPRDPPVVWIDGVFVDGRPLPVPPLGVRQLEPRSVPVGTDTVSLAFHSVDLRPGSRTAFRRSLHGDRGPWSAPQSEPRFELVGLGPGRYEVVVRAERDGVAGPSATVVLTVPPPVWRRWWVVTSVLGLVMVAAFATHRFRVGRLLAIQRMRSRIAADLHDELGLSLSRISILSEVARRRSNHDRDDELGKIGDTARELMEATSDMAWALDPGKDSLGHLFARLRRAASDVLEANGVVLEVDDDGVAQLALSSESRRSLYLILKEAVYNAARHAEAQRVTVRLRAEGRELRAEVEDDGCGFDMAAGDHDGEGRGMANMERRARELGGRLWFDTAPGRGTRVVVEAPIRRSRTA